MAVFFLAFFSAFDKGGVPFLKEAAHPIAPMHWCMEGCGLETSHRIVSHRPRSLSTIGPVLPQAKTVFLRTLVDRWIKSGELKSYCIARGARKAKFLIDPRDLADFIAKREFKPKREGR